MLRSMNEGAVLHPSRFVLETLKLDVVAQRFTLDYPCVSTNTSAETEVNDIPACLFC